jgi:hypothetical protein
MALRGAATRGGGDGGWRGGGGAIGRDGLSAAEAAAEVDGGRVRALTVKETIVELMGSRVGPGVYCPEHRSTLVSCVR